MCTGIIVATNDEISEAKKVINKFEEIGYNDLSFYKGKIEKQDIVLVKSGIGKVNAARTTQILIDKFDVKEIINIGAAGGINPLLKIKDIVIGDKLVQYDFDTTSLGNSEKGEILGIGKYIKSNEQLVKSLINAIESNKERDYNYKVGIIASADMFCTDPNVAKNIREEFDAECVEMEGAAIAQVCFLDKIPFVVIRGISDTPNGNNGIDYNTYCSLAAKQAVNILVEVFKNKKRSEQYECK